MKYVILFVLFGIASANEIQNEKAEETLKRGLTNKCMARETSSCIAIELVGYVDRMLRTASFQLADDVMIVDESHGTAAEIPIKSETLARSGTALEDQAQQLIMNKLWNFISSRSLRYRMLKDADLVIAGKQEKDGSLGVGVALKPPKAFESGRGARRILGPSSSGRVEVRSIRCPHVQGLITHGWEGPINL